MNSVFKNVVAAVTLATAFGMGYHFSLKNEPKENVKMIYQISKKTFPYRSVLAQLATAQAILESRLQGTPSLLARKYNNLFGITGSGTAGSVYLPTKEFVKGKWISTKQAFASNLTLEDSFNQYKKLLDKPRYYKVRWASTFEEAATEIQKAGYATDPDYANQLIGIYNTIIINL